MCISPCRWKLRGVARWSHSHVIFNIPLLSCFFLPFFLSLSSVTNKPDNSSTPITMSANMKYLKAYLNQSRRLDSITGFGKWVRQPPRQPDQHHHQQRQPHNTFYCRSNDDNDSRINSNNLYQPANITALTASRTLEPSLLALVPFPTAPYRSRQQDLEGPRPRSPNLEAHLFQSGATGSTPVFPR